MTKPSTIGSFGAASKIESLGPGRWLWRVPDGWQQGRGAFGGLVLGALARAMLAEETEPSRVLRTLTGELVAPVLPEDATIHVMLLRRGKGVTYLEAHATQGEEVVARATACLGAGRPIPDRGATTCFAHGSIREALDSPPPFESVSVMDMKAPPAPSFSRHYEFRAVSVLPFSGGREPVTEGWIRPSSLDERLDVPAVIGLVDAWFPALFMVLEGQLATATVTFTMELLADPATILANVPFYHRGRVLALHEGYFVEARELWQAGRLVALNQQTFALIGGSR